MSEQYRGTKGCTNLPSILAAVARFTCDKDQRKIADEMACDLKAELKKFFRAY
jgi:hypothetical protein